MKKKSTDLRSRTPQGVADDVSSAWDDNEPAIPRITGIPAPRPSDDAPRVPRQPQRDLSVAVAA